MEGFVGPGISALCSQLVAGFVSWFCISDDHRRFESKWKRYLIICMITICYFQDPADCLSAPHPSSLHSTFIDYTHSPHPITSHSILHSLTTRHLHTLPILWGVRGPQGMGCRLHHTLACTSFLMTWVVKHLHLHLLPHLLLLVNSEELLLLNGREMGRHFAVFQFAPI